MITLFGRLYIRYHQFGRLQTDDIFNVLAVLSLLAFTAIGESMNRMNLNDLVLALRLQLATDILLWTTLYLVKFSFLALMWSIFRVSCPFRKAWWTVTIYSVITFLIIFLL